MGHTAVPVASAEILVVRGDPPNAAEYLHRARSGAAVVIEGRSRLAELFGIQFLGDRPVRREVDGRYQGQKIVWENVAQVPAIAPPAQATVFAVERWSGIPLMLGGPVGDGRFFWVATPLMGEGVERYPYLPQALQDLGVRAALVNRRIAALYDYAYRTRTDPAHMARYWRRSGIGQLHVSAWYFMEADETRDAYLRRLIEECHRNGIVVYIWLELPHVSQAFWDANPQCREKNALGQDAAIFWRKNMNLVNAECAARIRAEVRRVLTRFDWDGANLAELYFEGPRGFDDPSEWTPMNDDVRADVRRQFGFDPADLFRADSPIFHRRATPQLRQYLDYRVDLQFRLHQEYLDLIDDVRRTSGKPLDITITYLEDLLDPSMRDLIGADSVRLLSLRDRYDFTLVLQDPSSQWSLGPSRYARAAELYRRVTDRMDKLWVDISIVKRVTSSYPTPQQTGIELMQLIQTVQRNFPVTMIYAESSILSPDADQLAVAQAVGSAVPQAGGGVRVNSPYGVGLSWTGPALVDGKPWPHQDRTHVWLTPGTHVVEPRTTEPFLRLTDFNGSLQLVEEFERGVSLVYESPSRAIAVVERPPTTIWIDGQESRPQTLLRRDGGVAILLPAGKHWVSLAAQPPPSPVQP